MFILFSIVYENEWIQNLFITFIGILPKSCLKPITQIFITID